MTLAKTLINLNTPQKPVIAIEGDIEGYFDNINHRILLRKLYRIGVKDKTIIEMIKKMLIAGYVYDKDKFQTEKGTVQGGCISPLLANVYLNDFDWMLGRMYHHPKSKYKNECSARTSLKRKDKTFAVRYDKKWIGITKAYITHSQWDKYNYNQKMPPYSEEGRKLYIIEKKGTKLSPTRPSSNL